MNNENSEKIFEEAKKNIPGGVNSPVRAFQSVNRKAPIFIKSASGSKIIDEDNNTYIDYIGSWGPLILGHNNENIKKGILETFQNGSSFGLPTKLESELASLIVETVPSIEKVRLTSSGTEATMSAIRLARAYTKRNKILKFKGCYHGHSDALLVSSGSGLLTNGYQDSNGITSGVLQDTLICDFGNIEDVKIILQNKDVAAVIVEPLPANMGIILTKKEFLEKLRKICDETGTILIFDEVISGYRLALGGAQEYFNVIPDLTTLGKIIGGGYPVGAFGGKKELMDLIAPLGQVYHAGTLSGNPVSVRAGIETIKYLKENRKEIYNNLNKKTQNLVEEIKMIAKKYNIDICVNTIASLFTIFFTEKNKVENLNDALTSDTSKFSIYFNTMLEEGIAVPPSQFEAHFLSIAHSDEDIKKTLIAVEKAFKKIKEV